MVRVYGWQYEELPCPFCDKGKITAKYYPSAVSEKRGGRGSLGKTRSFSKSKEIWIIESSCKACGKTSENIEMELKKRGDI